MRTITLLGISVLSGSVGCSSGKQLDELGAAHQALSADQARILGFEAPTSDWSSPSGGLSASSQASQGTTALAAAVNGWTEILSVPLSSLGQVGTTVSYDLLVPQAASWGETRLVMRIPSQGIWWQELGTQPLAGLSAGTYNKVEFALAPQLVTALQGSYSDLDFRIVINGPSGPYLLDNLVLTIGGAPDGGAGTPSSTTLSLSVPQGVPVASAFMSATDRLQVDDRVTLGQTEIEDVAGFGGVEIGAAVLAVSNVHSTGDVSFLRSQSTVRGFVKTTGEIIKQVPATILGGEFPHTPVTPAVTSWTVNWPSTVEPRVWLERDEQRPVAPGAYGGFNLQPGARASLQTGTYYFDAFNTEPEAQVLLDTARGPIVLYVRNSFTYKGLFVQTAGQEGQVLVGYLGTPAAYLEAPFVGTIVAPNAAVELRRPTSAQHKGSFFGKSIEVFSDAAVLHLPFNFSVLCPTGDRDGDGILDCYDDCPSDPNKSAPGICGCGRSERDRDSDGTPDCVDPCPDDAQNARLGQCGCVGTPSLKPAGTPCSDSDCGGSGTTCDGAGHCGDPNACGLAGCRRHEYDDHVYWFCPAASWQDALNSCDAVPGRMLVKLDTPAENAFVRSHLEATSWIGATDRAAEGQWHWVDVLTHDGPTFWSGGPQGSRVGARYKNWASGEPALGDSARCGAISTAGTWSDEDCTQAKPFVCERSSGAMNGIPIPRTWPTPTPGPQPPADCVPESTALTDQVVAALQACQAQCVNGTEEACSTVCSSVAPPPGAPACAPPTGTEPSLCELDAATLVPGASCTKENTTCPAGSQCGLVYQCAYTYQENGAWLTKSCTQNADCNAGHYCGSHGLCIDPSLLDACDLKDPNTLACVVQCFGGYACGTPVAGCIADDDSRPCAETSLCGIPIGDTVAEPNNGSDLTPAAFNPGETFGPPPDPPAGYLEEPCESGCPNSKDHPWCKYEVTDELPAKQVADTKKANKGSGAGIQFNVDPNVTLDYAVDPLPFGETNFNVKAAAQFKADASFNMFGVNGTLDVIDAKASIEANRCRFNTSDSRLEIFGHDFLPDLGIDKVDSNGQFPEAECQTAVDKYVEAASRAKKALRDVQELLRQYKTLRDAGTTFATNFCQNVAGEPPAGFPPGNCATETPEETINRFIQFYHSQAYALGAAQWALAGQTLTSAKMASIGLNPGVGLETDARESETVASVPFFIGPIPCQLEVETFVNYGIHGGLSLDLNPGAIANSQGGDLAWVTADAEPYANSGVTMFVGVGFGFDGFKAQAGITGEVTLGNLSLPAYARAGFSIYADDDPRDLPDDLKALSNGNSAFPFGGRKEYSLGLGYRYGASFGVDNLLGGSIGVRVRVKFAFFSRTWQKTLVSYTGYSPGLIPLLNGGYELATADDVFPWGKIRMPVPLPQLNLLPEHPPAPTPPGGGTAPAPQPFSSDRVGELFYDSLCTCQPEGKPCTRTADCCAGTCFSDPLQGGQGVCTSQCRAEGASCNQTSDCCGGACVNNTCSPCLPAGAACGFGTPCCKIPNSRNNCQAPLGGGPLVCECRAATKACNSTDECCTGNCVGGFCQDVPT